MMQPSPLDTPEHWLHEALTAILAGAWAQADAACQQALLLNPQHPEAHHLLGQMAGQLGDSERALALLGQAVALNPRHPQYRFNLAVSLAEAGRENEAALQYRACLRQQPDHRDALWNLGEMLRLAECFDLALALFERFEAGGGRYPARHHRIGVCLSALGRDAEACQRFELELAQPEHDRLTQWDAAQHHLSHERFAEGFSRYRLRFQANGRNSVYAHDFGLPPWPGHFETGQTLLVHGEQDLSEETMFASIVPQLLADAQAVGAHVVLAVKPPLVRLFTRSFPQAVVRAHKVGTAPADLQGLGSIHHQLPMGDLAFFYRRTQADFATGRRPYLKADPARAAWYRDLLDALEPPAGPPPHLRVGLMWGSGPAPVNNTRICGVQQRCVPVCLFEALAHLAPKVRFVSLQNGERGAEAALAPTLDILDLSALQTDFAETAALVEALDLVISVDTSVSHLVGGMGKPCWMPLMQRADWRHGRTREHSLWYQGTRYFRQNRAGDWADVLARIDAELQGILVDKTSQQGYELALAQALLNQRDLPASRQWFERALARDPKNPAVQWEYAMALLTDGHWGPGWDGYEARQSVFGWEALYCCPLPWPQWQGEHLVGKTIVVHGEQGIGDEIMYTSMLPDLLAAGARVVLACAPPLVQLMRDAFPTAAVVAHERGQPARWHERLPDWVAQVGPVDFQVPMGSLGRHWRRSAGDFPRRPYLKANTARVPAMAMHLAQALAYQPERPLCVGVAWSGNLDNPHQRATSLQPEQLLPLAQVPGVRLVGLQNRQFAADAARVPDLRLVDMSAFTDDFADLAALATQMDLVISTDSACAHLCGALGLPVWLPLRRNANWRWGWDTTDSVWYPGLRLFRQETDGEWAPVILDLRRTLTAWAMASSFGNSQ